MNHAGVPRSVLRSFLFVPGNQPRRVDKALGLDVDAIIFDLEDSVATSEKVAARRPVAEALARARKALGYVRVNAASTPYCYGDLVATVRPGVDGVVLPKVESAAELHAIDWLISNLEAERGMAAGTLDLIPSIETATGIQRVDRILQARSLRPYSAPWRVRYAAFGAADYARDLALNPGPDEEELAHARARLVLAVRAAGLDGAVDSPWFDIRDAAGFGRALERSRRAGFQGRMCIHPDQIMPVNAAYAPSTQEVEQARRMVEAFDAAERQGIAAVQVDGQMVDYPVVQRARAVLDLARRMESARSSRG